MKFTRQNIITSVVLWGLIFAGFLVPRSIAQQSWSQTQYIFNLYDVNLAYAGNHGTPGFALRHRNQWLGIDGAPVTSAVSANAPIANGRAGIGFSMSHEKIGLRIHQTARISGVWKVRLGNGRLGAGFGIGLIRQAFDRDKILAKDPLDPNITTMSDAVLTPALDAALFYSTNTFYTGLEISKLDRNRFNFSDGSTARNYYHIRALAGYKHRIGRKDLIEISALAKYAEGNLLQVESNVTYNRENFLLFGLGYRFNSVMYVLAGCHFTENFRIGLSYEFDAFSPMVRNSGGLELFLGYTLKGEKDNSIRYFTN